MKWFFFFFMLIHQFPSIQTNPDNIGIEHLNKLLKFVYQCLYNPELVKQPNSATRINYSGEKPC